MTLRNRWVTALRGATTRAMGRECDFAQREGDADVYDALGLLAYLAGATEGAYGEGADFYTFAGHDGMWLSRRSAEALAEQVGFPAASLDLLCELNDDPEISTAVLASWVEAMCPEA